jgi:predicted Fe-Mo cluster-binding NifX family protein
MKVAVPTWAGRISPVFDVAKRLLVVDIEDDTEIGRDETAIEQKEPVARARRVGELGINVLICGAISGPLEAMLVSTGVRVIPHTCGLVEDVLQAFVSGQLMDEAFMMPGCYGRRQQLRRRHRGGRCGFDIRERKG